MMVPIYLVKKKLDKAPVISSSTFFRSRDSTHWALVVDGIHYHITAKGQYSPIKLNPDPIPEEKLLPWTFSKSKYKLVGETAFGDYEIQSRAQAIVEIMGNYEILFNNCQVFANMLYLGICSTRPTFDLLGEVVIFRDMLGKDLRELEKSFRTLADRMHVPPDLRVVGPALDRLAKRYGR